MQFDTTALRYVSSANGDYLPDGAFFVEPVVEGNLIKLNAASFAGESNGDGTLAKFTADVTVHIYAVDRKLVRTLALGHQEVGKYHQRSRAAYWDGKNAAGETVASGVYFYTLTAGDFTATRKMLIRK